MERLRDGATRILEFVKKLDAAGQTARATSTGMSGAV
jgi:hypothetical protein